MTKPQLERMKFWIVKPYGGYNYLKNPAFAKPTGVIYWAGTRATAAVSGDEQRRGAYSMKVTPVSGQSSYVAYAGLAVTAGLAYTFSCDVKGVAGQAMRIYINAYAAKTFTATGYWQRVQVTATMGSGVTEAYVVVQRDSVANADPFYVDGVQFEQTMEMTTFIEGNQPGCGWVGLPLHSTSWRDPLSGNGGLLLDLSDYVRILSVHGLGMGNWNQVMTKMTSGGDMYQTHIRKSRNFSMVLAYTGDNQGDMQANRKVIIDALRPDYLFGSEDERRIIRYQGFDSNGDEATNPVDIVCVFQPSHTDTPSLPVFQKDVLNFTIPSGLLQGAYDEGAELDYTAEFAADYIVRRSNVGEWYEQIGYGNYFNPLSGLTGVVNDIKEAPNGDIYVCGGMVNVDGISGATGVVRWGKMNQSWEAVGAPNSSGFRAMAFTPQGDLLVGGSAQNIAGVPEADYFAKYTLGTGSPAAWEAVGSGIVGNPSNRGVYAIAISPEGIIYIGGGFSSASGNANCKNIAYWDQPSGLWKPLSTGLNNTVRALAFAPNGKLYIGGDFTDATLTGGDYICLWDGTSFVQLNSPELNAPVNALAFDHYGKLIAGGQFTNAGNVPGADYIARWPGSRWEALGTGVDFEVFSISTKNIAGYQRDGAYYAPKGWVYVAGAFRFGGGMFADRAAVYSNGGWASLDINLPGDPTVLPYPAVNVILHASDDTLYVGGSFSSGETLDKAVCGLLSDRVYNFDTTSMSANTYPVIKVEGPGILRSISNYSARKTIRFNNLQLNSGEIITLNLEPTNLVFTSNWSGRGSLLRYILPASNYGDFYLRPGSNTIVLFMTDTDSDTNATLVWRPKFWGLDGALL